MVNQLRETTGGAAAGAGLNATVSNASATKTACKNTYGWTITSASAGWTMNKAKGTEATCYVQGPAIVSGSPGSAAAPCA